MFFCVSGALTRYPSFSNGSYRSIENTKINHNKHRGKVTSSYLSSLTKQKVINRQSDVAYYNYLIVHPFVRVPHSGKHLREKTFADQ